MGNRMNRFDVSSRVPKFVVPLAFFIAAFALLFIPAHLSAQNSSQSQTNSGQATDANQNSGQAASGQGQSADAKAESARERHRRDKKLHDELASPYKKWLDEDVVYIITPEERGAFLKLQTNEEREEFIEQFWLRRNPDPDSPENTFKEEHYRRIAYANEHFASGIPGWKTDRGRIYIMWGPPDEIDSHPAGGPYERSPQEGGGETSTFPFEDWRYRYLEGMGNDVNLEFVDTSMSGEYHLTMDPSEKDALLYVPGAGLTMMESMGLASKDQRFTNSDGTHDAQPLGGGQLESQNEFSRLELYSKIQQAPPVKFKDLETVVTSRLVKNQVQFTYRFDFLRITGDTVLVPISVEIPNKQLSFQQKEGIQSATMNLFARITTLSGRPVQTFEDTINRDVPNSLLQQSLKGYSIYQKAVPLSPGLYRLDIVIKDVNSGNVGVVNTRLGVPHYEEDKLSSSSLILADQIQRVSSKDIGVGQFVLGDVKVRPKMDSIFATNDNLGIFLQVYNLKVDDKTHKADAAVQYRVLRDGTDGNAEVMKFAETGEQLGERGEELTLERAVALKSLTPGKYKLEVQITDNVSKETITPSAEFTVKGPGQ
jgi:GWxTD domain-containing protein